MAVIDLDMDYICFSFMPRPLALPPFSSQVTEASYSWLDPRLRASDAVVVSCAGRERCQPGYRVERPGFACFGLEFVAEGAGTVTLAGRSHRLQPGHLFLYGPRCPHVIATDPQRPMLKYFVDFFGQEAMAWFRGSGLKPGGIVGVLEIEAVRRLFEDLLRESRKPHTVRFAFARVYLELIFLKAREGRAGPGRVSSRSLETLQRCQHILDTRFAALHGLGDLAAAVGLAPSHLCRLFRRFQQGSPHACLVRRKLDHAAELLATRPALVKEVAAAVGYADALHFSRVFRRHFGCSPREFQLRGRQSSPASGHAVIAS